jgi:hypothetical protein
MGGIKFSSAFVEDAQNSPPRVLRTLNMFRWLSAIGYQLDGRHSVVLSLPEIFFYLWWAVIRRVSAHIAFASRWLARG